MELGKLIRTKRRAIEMSQQRLGVTAGMHFQAICAIEKGRRCLPDRAIAPVAGALSIPEEELRAACEAYRKAKLEARGA
jgi:DNA-binding XRE family transcriptional regulator